jgi:hypothetical protein
MDSETAAQQSAQLKHHKIMMFGKKQRYIEVFQCSGEDMNLVLNGGGYQYQNQFTSPSTISAKPLASSGMLPSRPQQQAQPLQISIPPPTITIPITLPQSASVLQNPASTSASIGASGSNQTSTSSIIAQQQQAHFIAQQSLIARQQAAAAAQMQAAQQQSEQQMAFFQNFNFLQQSPGAGLLPNMPQNPYSYPLNPQIPQFYFLPRPTMLPMNLMPSNAMSQMQYPSIPQNAAYSQSAITAAAAAGSIQPASQLASTGKRSYENAFRSDSMNVSAAKRAFHPPGSGNIYGNYPYS